jgi:hypothetical protein
MHPIRTVVGAWIVSALILAPVFAVTAGQARADGATNCGKVKGEQVRAIKGVKSRSACRELARIALTRYEFKPVCGQWGTGTKPCLAGGWYCSIPSAGVQMRKGLIAYCYDPKPGVKLGREEYAPDKYRGLIKIGGQTSHRAQLMRGECHTAVQGIDHLHRISCRAAIRVAEGSIRALGFPLPECPGDRARHWRGWKLTEHPTAAGTTEHPIIGTRFAKGGQSFLLSGGGAC